jgi:hypothetical protein
MRAILLTAMMLAPIGSFAAPVDQGAPSKAETPSTAPDPNERICKDIAVPGSRIVTHRFCATRAEWAAREREDEDAAKSMQRPLQTCNIMGTRRC